jgi:subtilisin family serine protease
MKEFEYIVTLRQYEDLDSFYEDMETPGGNLYIPDRAVDLVNRRPQSRNTHYMLTEVEAELIANDPRVLSIELNYEDRNLSLRPSWFQNSNFWNKSNTINAAHRNWGLLRSVEGSQRSNWGSNGTASVSGAITTTSSGKNVDVVVVDGHIDPTHPEFAVNDNGSGGSRVIQYNWFELNPLVTGAAAGTYVYPPYVDSTVENRTSDNDHGAHVTGILCGNTQGWARDANIYNINPYSSSNNSTSQVIDYLRIWHRTKNINPITGIKNPTVSNHSYGLVASIAITDITSVRFRGTVYNGPFTSTQLANYGIFSSSGTASIPVRSTAFEQDLLDAVNEGVIVVGAAGNSYSIIVNPNAAGASDYNNYVVSNYTSAYFYNRGTITAASNLICVGAIGTLLDDSKALYSNSGQRIDIFAPGNNIISCVNSNSGTTVTDPRNSIYKFAKKSGTSMATPQVAGVIACLAEQRPRMTQTEAKNYIISFAKTGQITATTGGVADYTDLNGASNRYLYYVKERPEVGQVSPTVNQGTRPARGMVFPRNKIFKYGH